MHNILSGWMPVLSQRAQPVCEGKIFFSVLGVDIKAPFLLTSMVKYMLEVVDESVKGHKCLQTVFCFNNVNVLWS